MALSRFYLERFGAILHHNVDKALLCGGGSARRLRRRRGPGADRDLPRRSRDPPGQGREGSGRGDRRRSERQWLRETSGSSTLSGTCASCRASAPPRRTWRAFCPGAASRGTAGERHVLGVGFAPLTRSSAWCSPSSSASTRARQGFPPRGRRGHQGHGRAQRRAVHLTVACAFVGRVPRRSGRLRRAEGRAPPSSRSLQRRGRAHARDVEVNAADGDERPTASTSPSPAPPPRPATTGRSGAATA